MKNDQNLAAFERLFQALCDTTRLRLLSLMAEGPVSVGYLAEQLGESQPKTSRHLAYLRNAGLVTTTRDGKWVYYAIQTQVNDAVQAMLMSTLRSIAGVDSRQETHAIDAINLSCPAGNNIYGTPHATRWEPNDIEVHLL